jgi:hypothetical protein
MKRDAIERRVLRIRGIDRVHTAWANTYYKRKKNPKSTPSTVAQSIIIMMLYSHRFMESTYAIGR